MQPEQLPPDHRSVTPWHYATLLPTLVGFIGVGLTFTAWLFAWEADARAVHLMAILLSVLMMVVSVVGLLGYLRQPGRYRRVKMIALWNYVEICNELNLLF